MIFQKQSLGESLTFDTRGCETVPALLRLVSLFGESELKTRFAVSEFFAL